MAFTILALIALFLVYWGATMYVMYRGFRLYHQYGVPMHPEKPRDYVTPWWNWKYMTRAFLLDSVKLLVLQIGITAACLCMAWLVL